MKAEIVKSLEGNLRKYRMDAELVDPKEDKAELLRIAKTAQSLIEALKNGDVGVAKDKAFGFSRNVSDAYCLQPESFKALAEDVRKVKSQLV